MNEDLHSSRLQRQALRLGAVQAPLQQEARGQRVGHSSLHAVRQTNSATGCEVLRSQMSDEMVPSARLLYRRGNSQAPWQMLAVREACAREWLLPRARHEAMEARRSAQADEASRSDLHRVRQAHEAGRRARPVRGLL